MQGCRSGESARLSPMLSRFDSQTPVPDPVNYLRIVFLLKVKVKVKVKSLYLTSVVPSATRLVSMEADGAPFTPSLCQCSILRAFKAIATRIKGKSKQTLKSPRIEPGTSRYKRRALPI